MQFQVGDKVVHPVYGVGVVTAFTQQQLLGDKTQAYYQVIARTTTILVPINDQGFTVLRKIAPKASLNECRKLLKGRPIPLNQDRKLRELELANHLKDRLLPALCETVRDLSAYGKQKTLGATASNLLKRSLQALCDEWAASDGVTAQTALCEIESLLQQGALNCPKSFVA